MYKIIGADGKEYGPISSEVLRQWIAEGRADANTRILPEGTTEWKPLSAFPEFTPGAPVNPPPLPTAPPPASAARERVSGPAVGLIVVAGLSALYMVAALVFALVGGANNMFIPPNASPPPFAAAISTVTTCVWIGVSLLVNGLVIFGAVKMRKLQAFGLAMTSSILVMIPCFSGPCCMIGLPIGIWSLVVLNKSEVKSAFH